MRKATVFAFLIFCTVWTTSVIAKEKTPFPQYKKAAVKLNNCSIQVEIADTQELRSHGLSGRESLVEDAGMLFVFSYPDYYSFWMKDMNFPLDFIWIKDGQVIDITTNVPLPAGPLLELPAYTPTSPINYMLEVNAGVAKKCGVKVGDKISLPDSIR